ncbi:hypothetical protein [Aerococcus urinaeequi]|uniref:hypothetical protein n=1 Tax=Aerococcus urinaeequi TaxID=51665 RepID=UPI003EC78A81
MKDSQIKGLSTLADSDTDRYAKLSSTKSLADQFLKAESIKDRLGNLNIIERRYMNMEYTDKEIIDIVNRKIDDIYTDEAESAFAEFIYSQFNQNDSKTDIDNLKFLVNCFTYANKLASKQATIATLNVLIELGVLQDTSD